jgi:hypothetical protein
MLLKEFFFNQDDEEMMARRRPLQDDNTQDFQSSASLLYEEDDNHDNIGTFYPSGDRLWLRRIWFFQIFVSVCIMSVGVAHNNTRYE